MKFTEIIETEIDNGRLQISLWFDDKISQIVFSHTCPECAGHGCRFRENACQSGQIHTTIKIADLKKNFSAEHKTFIISVLSEILKSIKK